MATTDVPLGTVHGIKIRINWSWLIIFVLLTWLLAVQYFPSHFTTWSTAEYWLVGVAAALLLFVSVLLHELSHSFVAQSRGLPVDSITLYVFGGVSNITREPASAGEEFWIAFAGPLSSVILGLIFLGLHYAVASPVWLRAIFGYLGAINIVLAVFNLIPAFPLDGGRVFRSIAWAVTHDLRRATRVATGVGQFFAWIFIFVGIWQALVGNFIGGIWLAFIGWFLHNAATASYRAAVQSGEFRSVLVGDMMSPNAPMVPPTATLGQVVHDHLLQQGGRALAVVNDGQLVGLLTAGDVRHFTADQWAHTTVHEAMTPLNRLDVVTRESHLADAMNLMTLHGHNQLPVVSDGRLAGWLTRADILRYIQTRHQQRVIVGPDRPGDADRGSLV